jgi:hypothetical protein
MAEVAAGNFAEGLTVNVMERCPAIKGPLMTKEQRELVALRALVRELRAALEARQRRRRHFEEAEALIQAIHDRLPGVFYVADVLVDPTLRELLRANGVDTARQLGALLRDTRRHEVGGLLVRQCKRDRFGWMWAIERA